MMHLLWLLLLTTTATAAAPPRHEPETVTLIHTNDIHAHLQEFNDLGTDCTSEQIAKNACYGGAPRIFTTVRALRKKYPAALLLDAGDQFQGTMFYTYFKGNVTAKFMNRLGYDLMTIGNHELDDGPKHLAKFIRQLNFPVVSANMKLANEPSLRPLVKAYHVFPKQNLAVIGFITNTTGYIGNAGPTVGFEDAVPAVQRVVDDLRAKGYKRIIAVSHNGYAEDQDVARRTSGLDVIVGGHSHTYLSADPNEPGSKGPYPTMVRNLDGEPTYIVQAKAWGKYVGHIDVTFDRHGVVTNVTGAPILLSQQVEQDARELRRVQRWAKEFEAIANEEIGDSTGEFYTEQCTKRECEVGDMVANAVLDSRQAEGAQLAIVNTGGIRSGLNTGPVTYGEISNMLPFGNAVVTVEMTGRQLLDVLEGVVTGINVQTRAKVTSFIQVAGIKFSFKPSAPAFSRLVDATLVSTNQPLQPEQKYLVATMDFVASGGDGIFPAKFPVIGTGPVPMDDVVRAYIKAHSPVTPTLDQRITLLQ